MPRRHWTYYSDHDPQVCHWLAELIDQGHLPDGTVDERDIQDVTKADLKGHTHVHFFAGIGGWAYALKLAGWPEDQPVWTGSCPCQPFSTAGKGLGEKDSRHLWPEFRRLIAECRPSVVFGEQVASKAGRAWVGAVRTDLEALAYGVGIADLCSPSVGAPNIRQRLWWVGDASNTRLEERSGFGRVQQERGSQQTSTETSGRSAIGGVADTERRSTERHGLELGTAPGDFEVATQERERVRADSGNGDEFVELGDPNTARWDIRRPERQEPSKETQCVPSTSDPWAACDWIYCRDGKYRPVEPGTFPLAHGLPARVGRLRGYGNAIVPQVAAEFIAAYREVVGA
jgi:DNA (cytosine-5)-methyltransferase 1